MPANTFWATKIKDRKLTGRVRFRTAVERRGFLVATAPVVVLQVEEEFQRATYNCPRPDDKYEYKTETQWRDTRALDLSDPAMRALVDMSISPSPTRTEGE